VRVGHERRLQMSIVPDLNHSKTTEVTYKAKWNVAMFGIPPCRFQVFLIFILLCSGRLIRWPNGHPNKNANPLYLYHITLDSSWFVCIHYSITQLHSYPNLVSCNPELYICTTCRHRLYIFIGWILETLKRKIYDI
jgi:hypothetical protein